MNSLDRLLSVAARVTLPPNTPMAAKKGSVGEVYLYGEIGPDAYGGISANAFVKELKSLRGVDRLDVHINSIGGSVFEGLAIYNAISTFEAKEKVVHVDALAASAASFIAMAGDRIVMAPDAMLMIHLPHGIAAGTASDMRATADLLDKATDSLLAVYNRRTGLENDQIRAMLEAETWLNADEAVAQRFADEVQGAAKEQPKRMAAAAPSRIAAVYSDTRKRIADAQLAVARINAESIRKKNPK